MAAGRERALVARLRAAPLAALCALTASALFFLLPLVVVVLNSVPHRLEIGRGSLIGWPVGLAWENLVQAWSGYCIAAALRRASGRTW